MKGSSKDVDCGANERCEGNLFIEKDDDEGASENTKNITERCDGSRGDSEHIEGIQRINMEL